MAERKTKPTQISAEAFVDAVPDPVRRADAQALAALMARVSGEPPAMWGPSIVGFGRYHYRYDSGHAGEMCRLGFSPRKPELVLYVLDGSPGRKRCSPGSASTRPASPASTSRSSPMWT